MPDKPPAYIFDTSAVIAYLAQEAGSAPLATFRRTAALPFIVLTELYYVTWRTQGQTLADRAVQEVLAWRVPILFPDERLTLSAGYLKARYRLGVADSFIAAFAAAHRATLVTKDPDFRALQPDLQLHYLH